MAKGGRKPPAGIISSGASGTSSKPKAASTASTVTKTPPTAKSIVAASASWTGKLPATLLHEHCQKLGWEKVTYDMKHSPGGFTATVVLSTRNPKTSQLDYIKLTPPEQLLQPQPTALEARHFAATYALHRIASHKNLSMVLPGEHKSLWRKLEEKRKVDVKNGHAAEYSADPFVVQRERDQAEAAAAEARAQKVSKKAAERQPGPTFKNVTKKGWEKVPSIDMAQKMRTLIERCIRKYHVWEVMSGHAGLQDEAVTELVGLGFRESHVLEAGEYTSNVQAALEWLLIHVPEDDLPARFLPENYTPGVTLITGSYQVEYAIKRITEAGFPAELARETLEECNSNEQLAMEKLMLALRHGDAPAPQHADAGDALWVEESETLAAIYGDRFSRPLPFIFEIKLNVAGYQNLALRFHRSLGYPRTQIPSLSLFHTSKQQVLPAYMRLSAILRAGTYAEENLVGDIMCYTIVEWMQENLHEIVKTPVKLKSLAGAVYGISYSGDTVEYTAGTGVQQKRRVARQTVGLKLDSNKLLQDYNRSLERENVRAMIKARQTLPAWEKQTDIVSTVRAHQVTLITGETGSGKSTQSVQFILDDMILRGEGGAANLLCTQPRRISAMGLAARVAEERGVSVGAQVGYAIRGESKVSNTTQIRFMTTGVLLRMLQSDSSVLNGVSHVVIDEVHERTLDSDFLLIVLKRLCAVNKKVKIVLMSATVNAELFMSYFGTAGHVNIEGRTFPVDDVYVDDILRRTGFRPPLSSKTEEDADLDQIGRYVTALGDRINYDFVASIVQYIDRDLGDKDGAILIFLPGTAEISRCIATISSTSSKFVCLPLHASLIPSDQRKVFGSVPRSRRKVVAATNVAETSITIPDVVAVIDTGRVKETEFDPSSSMIRLVEKWVSQAAAKQRRGRAGRVSKGTCYKMYTRAAEKTKMPVAQAPEMVRTPLEQLYLSVKVMRVDDVASFLREAIDPPDVLSIEAARNVLVEVGALHEDSNELTMLGSHLASIPADLKCAKLLVYGAIFGCLDIAVVAASVLTVRSPFMSSDRDASKKEAFGMGQGDVIADARAFMEWESKVKESYRATRSWCEEQCLSMKTMEDIRSSRDQYLTTLQEIGFIQSNKIDYRTTEFGLARALIAAAMTPYIARIQYPETKYEKTIAGAVALDPEARTIKLFTRDDGRIFIHPSSTLFSAQSFVGGAEFMAFFQKMATSKVFIRELTPFSAYGMLMFGGTVGTDLLGRGVTVGNWVRLRCWARIGVLVGRMRVLLDQILSLKIDSPQLDVSEHEIVEVVKRLIEMNGL